MLINEILTPFTISSLCSLVVLIIYHLLYKRYFLSKFDWYIKKDILKQQTDVVEAVKLFYVEKLESFKMVNDEKLENIKAANVNETETLKHTLNKLLTLQVQHRSDERQAMVNFLENCNQWVFNLYKIRFDDYGLQNINELKLKIVNIEDEYFLKIYAERVKIILFITNESVNVSMSHLINSIETYKINMYNILTEHYSLLKQQFNSAYEVSGIDEEGEYVATYYSIDNSQSIENLFLEFENFNGKSFKGCINKIENFAETAKKYLTSSEFNRP